MIFAILKSYRFLLCLLLAVGHCIPLVAGWKAGAASVDITPTEPLWMAGYAARTRPSKQVLQPIHTKALVLEDSAGRRSVLVTADLLGLPLSFTSEIAEILAARYGLRRDQVLFNCSHTHAGPVVGRVLEVAYDMGAAEWAKIDRYTLQLKDRMVSAVEQAMGRMQEVELFSGRTTAGFAHNRRVRTADGYQIGVNPDGPVDRSVPLLVVRSTGGALVAVVFGYACHNTTLQGDNYGIHGDYAGVAQKSLEVEYPGIVALFLAGCGADVNPAPRGTLELATQYGQELAKAVSVGIGSELLPLEGQLANRFAQVSLPFSAVPDRKQWESDSTSEDLYVRRRAARMLRLLDEKGEIPGQLTYPIQVWGISDRLTLVALGGEVVGDLSARISREAGRSGVWVAGYSNDVSAYIPSRRILEEGGYEAASSMIYYGQPAPFDPAVEETVVSKALELVKGLWPQGEPGRQTAR